MTSAIAFEIETIKTRVRKFIEVKLEEQLNGRMGGTVNHMTQILGKMKNNINSSRTLLFGSEICLLFGKWIWIGFKEIESQTWKNQIEYEQL